MRQAFQVALGALALAFCLGGAVEAARTPRPAQADDSAIAAAIANTDRPPADREEDSFRKPEAVLRLLGAHPGMHVIDYLAGDGYYSELLANVAGPKGKVYVYNNSLYGGFAGAALVKRFGNHRLPNTEVKYSVIADLKLPPKSLDAALFVMSYHDIYYTPKGGKPLGDARQLTSALFEAMKPGGVVVVEDHVAKEGSDPKESVDKLHRIDPAVVRRDFEAAGFKYDTASDALRRPSDDHTLLVFDPKVRHQTDLFLYRFRKP